MKIVSEVGRIGLGSQKSTQLEQKVLAEVRKSGQFIRVTEMSHSNGECGCRLEVKKICGESESVASGDHARTAS